MLLFWLVKEEAKTKDGQVGKDRYFQASDNLLDELSIFIGKEVGYSEFLSLLLQLYQNVSS